MPFTKYQVEPIQISANKVPTSESASNALESVSNSTLVNLIRQLSCLSDHCVNLFDDLGREAVKINERSLGLQKRIENLRSHVNKINLDDDENNDSTSILNYDEEKLTEKFSRQLNSDQKLFKNNQMPKFLQELYDKAEPPPQLDLFDKFREDGKSTMKQYSDPEFYLRKGYARFKKQINPQLKEIKKDQSSISSMTNSDSITTLNTISTQKDLPIAFQLSKINESSQISELKSNLSENSDSNSQPDIRKSINSSKTDNDINKRVSPLKTFDSKKSLKSNRKSFYQDILAGKDIKIENKQDEKDQNNPSDEYSIQEEDYDSDF